VEHGFHLVLFCIRNGLYLLENRRVEQMTSESILEALADKGYWIIKGIKGEFYPCKPDIFAATYDAV